MRKILRIVRMRSITVTRLPQLFWWMAFACCPCRTSGGRQSIGNRWQWGRGAVMAVALVAAIVNVAGAPVAQAATDHSTAAPTRVDNGNGVAQATSAPHAATVTGTSSRAPKEVAAPVTPTKSSPAPSRLTGHAQPAQAKPQHHTKGAIRYEAHHDHSAPL